MRRIVVFTLILLAGAARADEKPAFKSEGWVDDPKLQKMAPPNGVIANEKAFLALHKAWGMKDEATKIDFKKEFVIVATDKGSGVFGAVVSKSGDLKFTFGGPPKGVPGFAYYVQTWPREGIKTVSGKPLPKS